MMNLSWLRFLFLLFLSSAIPPYCLSKNCLGGLLFFCSFKLHP